MPILLPQLILRRISVCKRLLNVVLFLGLATPLFAEVITDGSAGPAQTLIGQPVAGGFSDFIINENLGTRAGANLFHSFERFNIASNEGAIFLGSPDIDNVISRVTGGQSSNINGLLFSNIGNQGFYFINPAGVMFGANAQIDVPASFYVSTANELRFSDGSIFSATNPNASTFSIDQPEAFGFLGDQSGRINFTQSHIGLKADSTFAVSGGSLVIDATKITFDRGEIQLIATDDAVVEVTLSGELSASARGDLDIVNSIIDVTGDGAGRILIHGGASEIISSGVFAENTGSTNATSDQGIDIQVSSLTITGSLISTDTYAQGQNAADLSVLVDEKLSIVNVGVISSTTSAAGDAGKVKVSAGQLKIDGQGRKFFTGITSNANSGSSGNAGAVEVDVKNLLSVVNGGVIGSNTFSDGNAGKVKVSADQLDIDGRGSSLQTGIASDAYSGSSGNAGVVEVYVGKQLSVINGGQIRTNTFASGDAGEIKINAGQLKIDNQRSEIFTGIFSVATSRSSGDGGTVVVTVSDELSLINGGAITSSTGAVGDAGNVKINAGQLVIDGRGNKSLTGIFSDANPGSSGDVGTVMVMVTDQLSLFNGGTISSNTGATGDAGNVKVNAVQLAIDGQGSEFLTGILSATSPDSIGDGGSVTVTVTDQLSLVNGGVINTNTGAAGDGGNVKVITSHFLIDGQGSKFLTGILSDANPRSSGDAGIVEVTVTDQLLLVNGGRVSSSTFAAGNGGSVTIDAGKVFIDRQNNKFLTGILSTAEIGSLGQAGNIIVNTHDLSIVNDGLITIQSLPTVDTVTLTNIQPTEINISAQNTNLTDSSISTESFGNVPAGSITINIAETLSLDPSFINTAANNADGGDISINARIIDLLDSQITTSVSGQGDGGNISLNASTIILDSGFIQANTAGTDALGGDIKINTQGLITSRNLLLNGDGIRLTFQPDLNVVQAAAPDGVSGIINITSPELDISGDLSKIETQLLDLDKLTKDPCTTLGGRQSRLANLGRGNLPETPENIGSMALSLEYISHFISPNQVDLVIQDKTSNNSFPPVISRITGLARLKTGSTIPSNRDCRGKWMTL